MRVIGTAGHVDHGKSTLVRALSGIDPDRLKEEKARGMTIDLGFAWISLPETPQDSSKTKKHKKKAAEPVPEIDVGIVDVPGHIDFIKNMLAGVGSVDAVMLVIAADEGVMPQTREHLAILDLLAVPDGIVALTKVDLIDDEEWLELVELDIADLLQETRFADAPIVHVSAESGDGLDDIRNALSRTLHRLSPRRNRARPRLPIDRIFSLSGFGTVVTGTLSDGEFTVGDAVEILPNGISARIRGLQSHNRQIWQADPGGRLAMNLSGVGTDELKRGHVVTKPDTLRSTMLIDVAFRLLADAPKPIVHNQPVDFFSGAAEIPARIRLIGSETLEPGEEGWLQLRLEKPVVVAAGDRYILRQPSPSATLGGGAVLSPHPRRRWKRFDPTVVARLQVLAQGAPDEILLQVLTRQPLLTKDTLFVQSELDLDLAQSALDELLAAEAILRLGDGSDKNTVFLTRDSWMQIRTHLTDILEIYHKQSPLSQGIQRGELRTRLQSQSNLADIPVRLFNFILVRTQDEEVIESNDTAVWQHGFTVTLTLHQQSMVDQLLAHMADAGYSPPNEGDILRELGQESALLEMLIEQGELVRVSGNVLFRQVDFDEMVAKVKAYGQANGSITLAQTRDLFQTSRKYAQAVLEEMDTRRITRRQGDVRIIRQV